MKWETDDSVGWNARPRFLGRPTPSAAAVVLAAWLGSWSLAGCGDSGGSGSHDASSGDGASVDACGDALVSGDSGGGGDSGLDASSGRDGALDAALCSGPQDCDDGNDCTADDCIGGHCVHAESCCNNGADDDADGDPDCSDPDCASSDDCSECAPVADPAPISDAPLPGENPPGTFETAVEDGFHDEFVFDSSHYLKVGVRREWGGSIIFYGIDDGHAGMNGTNAIDANDTGREVQVAFYDPDRSKQNCAWNASCASNPSQCENSITFLGWNPVQGGNRCNRGSGVESVDQSNGVLTVSTNPLFWNPNWDRQDCSRDACDDPILRERRSDVRVIQRLRFVRTHIVELDYTVVNLAGLDHRATAQEMPTVYTGNGNQGPDLWRLFNSDRTEISIDQGGNDGFHYKNFQSPGGWATMQKSDLSYGVGLYVENRNQQWQAWQLRSLPFNNFRPLPSFGIPANGTVRARAYLILGSLDTVASLGQWLDAHLPPFGVIDEPVADASVSGQIQVRGWALDNKGVASVHVLVDGVDLGTLAYGTSRPDVCLVWPGYRHCDAVGYAGTLDTSRLTACPHLLEVRAVDGDGNSRVIAARRIFVTR